jgi:class III poly(R)-hydroxyalkanoic acid synthase PhaE subunit
MTGFKDSTEAWSKAWLDAQKQYLNTWMQMSKQGTGWPGSQSPLPWSGASPWSEPMQQWTRMLTQALPRGSQDTSTRLFELGKSFMTMGETVWRLLQEGKDIAGSEINWQETMKNALAAAGGCFDLAGQSADPWSGFATFWGLPLRTWERFACSFSPLPGELAKAPGGEEAAPMSDMTRAVRQLLSLPAVGYTREWQEQAQEWMQLYLEYTKAVQDFARLLGKVSQRAAELFSHKLAEQLKEGKSLEGLRAAYNLWIDCGEEAYSEVVATPEFPHLQAQMVNALMRLKRHEQLMIDEGMTALNMPTRRELDTTHKRIHGLQQQLRTLQDALEDIQPANEPGDEPPATAPRAAATRSSPARKKAAAKAVRGQPKRRVQPKKKG